MSIRRSMPVEQADWRIEPPLPWVIQREPEWSYAPPDGQALALLLADEQHDVLTQAVFTRTVRRLLTHAAVQALGQVEIDFDPAAHALRIHELVVWRPASDGAWERRFEARREHFLLRQREQGLERQILNGRLSLVALLEDLRVGDAIDVSWTLEPNDLLPGLRFATIYAFAWNVPVACASLTLHLNPAAPVTWRVHTGADVEKPTETAGPGNVTWTIRNPSVLDYEPNAPGSTWPCAVVDVSGWKDWTEVASFFADLWADALTEGADAIGAEIHRLRAEHEGESLIREILRFVQEDVRYLSVDFGHGAGLLPSGAGSVLRRRFGDCKDKALLLSALLQRVGVDACPMLVAAGWTTAIERMQPSVAVFSHAIVRWTNDGVRHFVDPTFVGQGGPLVNLSPPPYGCGLEVLEGTSALVPIPRPLAAMLTVIETFELDRKGGSGSVEQILIAEGSLADDMRANLLREGPSAFAAARTKALQGRFPALVPDEAAPSVSDDREINRVEVRSRHALPSWGPVGQPPPPTFQYGAFGLFYAIEAIEGPDRRRLPWLLRYPLVASHRLVVRGKSVRRMAGERHRIDGPGFEYACDVTSRRREVIFDYRWTTTRPEISPQEWPEYRRARDRAFEHAGANVATALSKSLQRGLIAAGIWLALIGVGIAFNAYERRHGLASGEGVARLEASVESAREAVVRGDFVRAIEILEVVAPRYSDSPSFHALRIDAAIGARRIETAREAIATLRRLDPDGAIGILQEARLALLEGNLHEARAGIDVVLSRDPRYPPALFLLATVAQQQRDAAGARDAWERLLSVQPGHPGALLSYSLLLWNLGERIRADSTILEFVRAQPARNAELEAALAAYFDATGRPLEALEPAERAAELAPDSPEMANQVVRILLRTGRSTTAFDAARRMVERFPGDPLALSALALAAAEVGQDDVASSAYEEWRKQRPEDSFAVANHGYFLLRTGQAQRARALLERGTRDHPGAGLVWLNYAAVLEAGGDTEGAAAARHRADELLSPYERSTLMR